MPQTFQRKLHQTAETTKQAHTHRKNHTSNPQPKLWPSPESQPKRKTPAWHEILNRASRNDLKNLPTLWASLFGRFSHLRMARSTPLRYHRLVCNAALPAEIFHSEIIFEKNSPPWLFLWIFWHWMVVVFASCFGSPNTHTHNRPWKPRRGISTVRHLVTVFPTDFFYTAHPDGEVVRKENVSATLGFLGDTKKQPKLRRRRRKRKRRGRAKADQQQQQKTIPTLFRARIILAQSGTVGAHSYGKPTGKRSYLSSN